MNSPTFRLETPSIRTHKGKPALRRHCPGGLLRKLYLSNTVPTALVALTLHDGIRLCDRLNRRLGFDTAAWTAIAARFMRRAAGHGHTVH